MITFRERLEELDLSHFKIHSKTAVIDETTNIDTWTEIFQMHQEISGLRILLTQDVKAPFLSQGILLKERKEKTDSNACHIMNNMTRSISSSTCMDNNEDESHSHISYKDTRSEDSISNDTVTMDDFTNDFDTIFYLSSCISVDENDSPWFIIENSSE